MGTVRRRGFKIFLWEGELLILTPKRKTYKLAAEKEIDTIVKKTREEITNKVDTRNLGYFDYRLRIPVGTDCYD